MTHVHMDKHGYTSMFRVQFAYKQIWERERELERRAFSRDANFESQQDVFRWLLLQENNVFLVFSPGHIGIIFYIDSSQK